MAATLDTRVVLGDRDLPTTISRCVAGVDGGLMWLGSQMYIPIPKHEHDHQYSAWDCLSPGDKAGVVLEFLVLALLPAALARRVLRLPLPALPPVRRGSDAGAEASVDTSHWGRFVAVLFCAVA